MKGQGDSRGLAVAGPHLPMDKYTFMIVVYKPDGTPLCLVEKIEDAQFLVDKLNGEQNSTDERGRSAAPRETRPASPPEPSPDGIADHLFVPSVAGDTNSPCYFCEDGRENHRGPSLANTGMPDQEPVPRDPKLWPKGD